MANRTLVIAALVGFSAAAPLAAQAPTLKWGDAPPVFPPGAKMAVLYGDPGKAANFTVRLEFPDGYTIPPHHHPTDEEVTVISGSFMVGMGDTTDTMKMMTLPAGGFATAPAMMNHYGKASGNTVVQVSAMGPFAMTYVNPTDDPTRKPPTKK